MGGVVELFLVMLIIAAFAFAPLGYFIYMYTAKNGEPFGDIEPHGDSDSWVLDQADRLIHLAKEKLAQAKK